MKELMKRRIVSMKKSLETLNEINDPLHEDLREEMKERITTLERRTLKLTRKKG